MLNYIWAFFLIIGIIVGAFTGRMEEVTNAVVNSSKEAITIALTLLGVVSMWSGIMKIAEAAKVIESLSKKMTPILNFLFPEVPQEHPARKYIATNIIANMLGLGWAATPPGLEAMKSLQELNPKKDEASTAMCTFLILNISSVQIISINMIAYRMEYNSSNPAEIVGPALLATIISTLAGVTFAKLMALKTLRKGEKSCK